MDHLTSFGKRATALIYDALRLAQAEIANKVDVEPERISPEKLFPRIIENMVKLTWAEQGAEKYYFRVKKWDLDAPPPDLHLEKMAAFRLSLHGITLEKRNEIRRKRRYCKGRRHFTSYSKIPGAKKYVRIKLSGYDSYGAPITYRTLVLRGESINPSKLHYTAKTDRFPSTSGSITPFDYDGDGDLDILLM